MATINSAVCSEDLIRQCKIALETIGNLNYALMNLYQVPSGGSRYDAFKAEVFEMIYTFLGHATRISWMLWPDTVGGNGLCHRRFTKIDGHQTKGSVSQSMRYRALETPGTRSLKNLKRTFSYSLALKAEISGAVRNPAVCHIIGSPIAVTDFPYSMRMRIYDPTTRDFHMDGTIFPLQEIAAAIALLHACAHRKEKPPARISRTESRHRFTGSRRSGVREAAHH